MAAGGTRLVALQRLGGHPAMWRAAVCRLRGVNLVARFTLLGAAVGVLVASSALWFFDAGLTNVLLKQAAARANDQVRLVVLDHMSSDDFAPPHTRAKLEDLSARLAPLLGRVQHGSGVIGVNLVAPDGVVLYSDLIRRGGQQVPPSDLPLLAHALAGGVAPEIDTLSAAEDADLGAFYESAFEIYVPVVLDGRIVGAYEVYQDPALARPVRPLVWGIIVGLFGALFHIAIRAAVAQTRPRRARRVRRTLVAPQLVGLGTHGHCESLTPRELEVLKLLAASHIYKDIATRLGLSEETVRSHVKRILHKLGQPDRTQAVVAALKAGILRLP